MHYPIEGVVIGVHFPSDNTNLSKREIEYDVRPVIVTMGRINNVPLAMGLHGIVDDEDTLLRPAALVIPSGSFSANESNPSETDGDRVLVQFVNGSPFQPVITHVLSHNFRGVVGSSQHANYRDKSEVLIDKTSYEFGDGSGGSTTADTAGTTKDRVKHSKINGTHLAVDANGDVFINFKEHPNADRGISAGSVTKKLVIQNEGVDFLRLEKVGDDLNLFIGESLAANILVQIADGAKSVVIGEALKSYLDTSVKNWTTAHTHPDAMGGTGTPVQAGTYPTFDDSAILSDKVKIPDNG